LKYCNFFIDPAETTRIFLTNFEIVKQLKNFMQNFSRVNDPAEMVSVGSMTPPKWFQWGLKKFSFRSLNETLEAEFRGLNDTEEADSAVLMRSQSQ
jgi:hypothetical protein